MFTSSVARAALALALTSAAAGAQSSPSLDSTEHETFALARRSSASLTVIQSRPQGAFSRNVGSDMDSMARISSGSTAPVSGACA